MNLLMVTRKIDQNDASPAGFTYDWVKKIGENLENLFVITWQKSSNQGLPKNIKIIELPENKLLKILALQIKLFKILPKVDGVFCHQNPEYTILAGPLARTFRKKIIAWYTHKAVNWKLRWVNFFADKILTASKESCRLKDRRKIEVVGHGIDVDKFKSQKPAPSEVEGSKIKTTIQNSKFKIISVGRISPAKDYETLVSAAEILVKKGTTNFEIEIIGQPALETDKKYFADLKQLVKNKKLENYLRFSGGVAHNQITPYYQKTGLFVNLSQTGSVDKAVLEAMACEGLVLTSNEAFVDILKDNRLIFKKKDPQDLAGKIINLMNLSQEEKKNLGKKLRAEVVKEHNLDNLADKIIREFS